MEDYKPVVTLATDLLQFTKKKMKVWRILFFVAAVGWIVTLIYLFTMI